MVTGIFAGVIGSIVLAIAADLFSPQLRGRVMGFIQTAFAASQVLGLPFGLYLSNHWGWHSAFLALVVIGGIGGLVIILFLKPVNEHLKMPQERSPFMHMLHTITEVRYLTAFAAMALLTTGGYMLMPFSSAFVINNLGIDASHLPTIYLVTGLGTIFVGPLVGKAADSLGKVPVFLAGCVMTIIMVLIYTHLQTTTLPWLILVNVLLFLGIFSRIIPFQALISTLPEPNQRGSFNALNSAVQQLSGGFASLVAGHLIAFGSDGKLLGFETIGYVMVATTAIAAVLVVIIQRQTLRRGVVTTRL
jgi:predicted MFS family arabinose efflux permease